MVWGLLREQRNPVLSATFMLHLKLVHMRVELSLINSELFGGKKKKKPNFF